MTITLQYALQQHLCLKLRECKYESEMKVLTKIVKYALHTQGPPAEVSLDDDVKFPTKTLKYVFPVFQL